MTTATALWKAARDIFSLNVQFPLCSRAIHCLILGGTKNRVWGSQPRWSATKQKRKKQQFFLKINKINQVFIKVLNCSPNTPYPKRFERLTASRAMSIPMNLNPHLYRERQAPLKCYLWCKCEPWKLLFSFIDWQRWNRLITPSAGWSPPDAPIPQHPGGWDLPLTSAHSLALTLLSTPLPYSHFPTPSHPTPTLQKDWFGWR